MVYWVVKNFLNMLSDERHSWREREEGRRLVCWVTIYGKAWGKAAGQ